MADKLDTGETLEALQHALHLQATTVLIMTHMAGSLRGLQATAVKESLRGFIQRELSDTYQLIEKYSALGGQLELAPAAAGVEPDATKAIDRLIEHEQETVAALHAVIQHSGQEPRSEALGHLLEHCIMRKQQQLDFLWHSSERDEPLGE